MFYKVCFQFFFCASFENVKTIQKFNKHIFERIYSHNELENLISENYNKNLCLKYFFSYRYTIFRETYIANLTLQQHKLKMTSQIYNEFIFYNYNYLFNHISFIKFWPEKVYIRALWGSWQLFNSMLKCILN